MRKGMVWAMLSSVVLLAACSGTPEVQMPVDEPTDGPVTLRVAAYRVNSDEVIAAFHARHPNIRVETTTSDDELSAVDIQRVTPDLIRAGKILPLDGLVQKSGLDLKPYGELLQRWEGKLYDLPASMIPWVLVYNRDMMTQAGIKPPGDVVTWEQVREMARTLSRDGDPGLFTEDPEFLVTLYLGQASESPVPTKDLTEALQFFHTMIFTDKSMPVMKPRVWPPSPLSAPTSELFRRRRAGLTLGYVTSTFGQSGSGWPFDTGYLLVKNAKGVPTYTISLGISATTHHPTAAWEFLSFLAGPEGQAVVARRDLPAYRTPQTEAAWFAQDPPPPSATRALFQTRWFVPERTKNDSQTNFNALMDAANQVLSGQATVAEAVKVYQQSIK